MIDRILMPAFSTLAVRGMYDDMYDIISQCTLKWERLVYFVMQLVWLLTVIVHRFGPSYKIDASADFTRVTFDAIALCTMSYR